ncbi:MAG: hypothetical protein IPK60_18500 [Sandaracinaceae bacterium]|nr:hypothetical protein [Sandaracinaceae bacterium]
MSQRRSQLETVLALAREHDREKYDEHNTEARELKEINEAIASGLHTLPQHQLAALRNRYPRTP